MSLTLKDVRGFGNPLRAYNFDLIIPVLPGGAAGEALRLHIVSTNIPGFSSEPMERAHHGVVIKHAGRGMYPRSWTNEFFESADLKVYNALLRWHGLQWDRETGAQADDNAYKTEGYLHLLGNDRKPTKKFVLEGLWIEDIPDVLMDSGTSEVVRVPVTWSYDRWVEG